MTVNDITLPSKEVTLQKSYLPVVRDLLQQLQPIE